MTTNNPGGDHAVEKAVEKEQSTQETQARQDSQAIRQDSQAERQDTQATQLTADRFNIDDIEHRLVDGLLTQGQLVDEIHSLQSSNTTIRKIVVAMAVAVVLSLGATGVAIHAVFAVRANAAQDVVRDYERCRSRNLAPRSVRDSFTNAYDVLEELLGPESRVDIDRLREAIAPAELTDIDCNGDNVLDGKDYSS